MEELSCTTAEGITAYAYKIGKLVLVSIDGDISSFTNYWKNYPIVTVDGVTAKKGASSVFNNQRNQTGALSIARGSNNITLNYFGTDPVLATNSWIRGQLFFVCN